MAYNIMTLFDATLSPLVCYQNSISHPRGLWFGSFDVYIIYNDKKICIVFFVFFFLFFFFIIFFLIQFNVPFKIISAHMRRANQSVGRKRETPEKNHLTHPQAELGLSHMWPERGSNPHQTQR